jgi:hypothetical protein
VVRERVTAWRFAAFAAFTLTGATSGAGPAVPNALAARRHEVLERKVVDATLAAMGVGVVFELHAPIKWHAARGDGGGYARSGLGAQLRVSARDGPF